jgi:hypothetical protein
VTNMWSEMIEFVGHVELQPSPSCTIVEGSRSLTLLLLLRFQILINAKLLDYPRTIPFPALHPLL